MTDSEKKIFEAIVNYIAEHKYPPSVRELCESTGITSTSVMHKRLKTLAEKGYISMEKGLSRGIVIKTQITNYDRIRNMSVEEMSNFLMNWFMDCMSGNAPMNVKAWLESEVQGE